jgi:hypothetical protein
MHQQLPISHLISEEYGSEFIAILGIFQSLSASLRAGKRHMKNQKKKRKQGTKENLLV